MVSKERGQKTEIRSFWQKGGRERLALGGIPRG